MSAVPLHAVRSGSPDSPPIIIIHGLLGSTRNWTTIARALAVEHDVHCLDLRNHGQSPHAESMRWSDMEADLVAYVDRMDLDTFELIGHSLGGKLAMRYATVHPARVSRLVICDIVQREYPPFHAVAFDAMERLNLESLSDRKEAESRLEESLSDWAFRQFILTNLARDPVSGRFFWKVNLPVLKRSLSQMARPSITSGMTFGGESLLIAGRRSDFVRESDLLPMRTYFPDLAVKWLEVGHNVHVEDRQGFLDVIRRE